MHLLKCKISSGIRYVEITTPRFEATAPRFAPQGWNRSKDFPLN